MVIGGDPYFLDLVVEQGEPFGELYSRGLQRDDKGRVIVNSNGLPNVTSGRSVSVGNFNPDWKGGISSSLSYKDFSVSFLIDHRQGGDMAMMSDAILAEDGQLQRTVQDREGGLVFGQNFFSDETAVLEDGTTNDIEIDAESFWKHVGGEAAPVGEVFTEDATNTRLREMTIGYNLPLSIIDGFGISNAKISIVGRNLFYIYRKTKNLDPDITVGTGAGTQGFVNFAPPTTRQLGMNLELDF